MSTADIQKELLPASLGTPDKTQPVLSPSQLEILTDRRETDCRTALTRGMAEYLEQLAAVMSNGREIRFKQVLETWAEPELPATYPAAIVYATDAGTYDAHALTPQTFDLGSGLGIRKVAEYQLDMMVEIWSTSPIERMAIVAMLEDALDPTDFMTGVRLTLPHYHGARATYEKMDLVYADLAEDAQRRWRRAMFTVRGTVAQYRRLGMQIPRLKTKIDVAINDEEFGAEDP